MIKDYNKNIIIKDVTTGDIVETIDYASFNFGPINGNCHGLGFMDLKLGHLYMLQEVLGILSQEHDVYIFTGYKK